MEKYINLSIKRKKKLTKFKTIFYIPPIWSKIILKPKYNLNFYILYLVTNTYYFKIIINNNFLKKYLDLNTNSLVVSNYFESSFWLFYKKLFDNLIQTFSYWFFTKLKIKGKGYYVYKNFRNTITHQFGHSHRRYLYSFFTFVKFLSKIVIFIAGSSKNDIFKTGRLIQKSKNINIFTGRGVRFSKQVIYKKTGKVSSYR